MAQRDERLIREMIMDTIVPPIYERTERSPMIMPVLLDINISPSQTTNRTRVSKIKIGVLLEKRNVYVTY